MKIKIIFGDNDHPSFGLIGHFLIALGQVKESQSQPAIDGETGKSVTEKPVEKEEPVEGEKPKKPKKSKRPKKEMDEANTKIQATKKKRIKIKELLNKLAEIESPEEARVYLSDWVDEQGEPITDVKNIPVKELDEMIKELEEMIAGESL